MHRFSYAVYPHAGNAIEAGVRARGYDFNYRAHALRIAGAQEGTLPAELSMLCVDAPNIVVETVKKAEDANALIVRMYEAENCRTVCRLKTAFRAAVAELIDRLLTWEKPGPIRRILALHASQRSTSNTLAFWELVRTNLPSEIAVEEIGLRNGTVPDCNGCSYTACLHFGEQGSCFYGSGPMVEEVYPAVRRCDALVMLCANYNDALSANLTACVNRLTALFRQQRFYEKRLFGLVVSGYSGGDLLARQLISALNMNKSFFLPPYFCLLETANERGSLVRLPGIAQRASAFAGRIAGA